MKQLYLVSGNPPPLSKKKENPADARYDILTVVSLKS
jgi:hypothetical protein